jgi:hypothetical protein
MTDVPAVPSIDRLDPARVGLLLTEAGWQVVGQRQGAYVRMAPPGEYRNSVLVPLDRTAPEFEQAMLEALSDIQTLSARDFEMTNISARLLSEPTDGFRFRAESAAPRGLIGWTHGERLIHNARLLLATGAKTYMGQLSYFGNRFGQFANRYLETVLMGQTAPGSYVVSAFVPSAGFVPLTAPRRETAPGQEVMFDVEPEAATTRLIGISAWSAANATAEAIAHYRHSASLAAFQDFVPRGVSHEMVSALKGMVEGSDGAELSVEWDPAIPLPADVPTDPLHLQPGDVEVLSKADSELLARVAAPEVITFTGWVHLLTRKEAGGPGVIGIDNITYDKPRRIRVHLTDDDYHRALRAHDEDRAVVVEGRIEREGNINWMYDGRLATVLGSVEEIRAQFKLRPRHVISGQVELGTDDEQP